MANEQDLTITVGTKGTEKAIADFRQLGEALKTAAGQQVFRQQDWARDLDKTRQAVNNTVNSHKEWFKHIELNQLAIRRLSSTLYQINPLLGQLSFRLLSAIRIFGRMGGILAGIGVVVAAYIKHLNSLVQEAEKAASKQESLNKIWAASPDQVSGLISGLGQLQHKYSSTRDELAKSGEAMALLWLDFLRSTKAEEEMAQQTDLLVAALQRLRNEEAQAERVHGLKEREMQLKSQREAIKTDQQRATSLGEVRKGTDALARSGEELLAISKEQHQAEITELERKRKLAFATFVGADPERDVGTRLKAQAEMARLQNEINQKNRDFNIKAADDQRTRLTDIAASFRQEMQQDVKDRTQNLEQMFNLQKQHFDLMNMAQQDYFTRRKYAIVTADSDEITSVQETARLDFEQAQAALQRKVGLIDAEIAEKQRLIQAAVNDLDKQRQLKDEINALGADRLRAEVEYNNAVIADRQRAYEALKGIADKQRTLGGGIISRALDYFEKTGYKGPVSEQLLQQYGTFEQQQAKAAAFQMSPFGQGLLPSQLRAYMQVAPEQFQLAQAGLGPQAAVSASLAGYGQMAFGQAPSATPFGYLGGAESIGELRNVSGSVQTQGDRIVAKLDEIKQSLQSRGGIGGTDVGNQNPQSAGGAESYRYGLKYTNAPSYYDWDVRSKEQEASRR